MQLADYIMQQVGCRPKQKGGKILLNPCPICGHKDHFYVYPQNNSYYSFSGCCKGGSIVDWMMEFEGLSLSEAMERTHGKSKPIDRQKQRKQEQNKRLAELLIDKVEGFFHEIIQKYKTFSQLEQTFKEMDITYTDPAYRFIRQAARFYDRVSDEFIAGDFRKRVKLMQEHRQEYIYKLQLGGGTFESYV